MFEAKVIAKYNNQYYDYHYTVIKETKFYGNSIDEAVEKAFHSYEFLRNSNSAKVEIREVEE